MSLFFYDVCLSSKTMEKELQILFVKIFSSSLLCCILSALFICSSLDNCRRRREKKRKKDNRALAGLCFSSSFHAIVVFTPLLFRHHELFITSIERYGKKTNKFCTNEDEGFKNDEDVQRAKGCVRYHRRYRHEKRRCFSFRVFRSNGAVQRRTVIYE